MPATKELSQQLRYMREFRDDLQNCSAVNACMGLPCWSGAPGPEDDESSAEVPLNVHGGEYFEDDLAAMQDKPKGPRSSTSSALWRTCCFVNVLLVIGLAVVAGYAVAGAQTGMMGQASTALPLVKDYEGGQHFGLANMSSVPLAKWAQLSKEFIESWTTDRGQIFGYASADDAPRLLYEGSKVDGVWDEIPEKLRGVYWMRGNPMPEVLAVVQYGMWYEEEQILLMPNSPWTTAWWGGGSDEYPNELGYLGRLLSMLISGRSLAESYADPSSLDTAISLAFSNCPGGLNCKEGSRDLAYGVLMSHTGGDLSKRGMVYYDGCTMEEMPSKAVDPKQRPGSLYFRRTNFLNGLLSSDTGYNLTKIVDAVGHQVEPYYTEYLEFMSNKPLVVWAGATKKAGGDDKHSEEEHDNGEGHDSEQEHDNGEGHGSEQAHDDAKG